MILKQSGEVRIVSVMDSFFFNDTATTEIYTLSLHDALPIFCRYGPWDEHDFYVSGSGPMVDATLRGLAQLRVPQTRIRYDARSEEHTSELQSRQYLVCRLLLEKKNFHFFS